MSISVTTKSLLKAGCAASVAAQQEGMSAPIPQRRSRPVRTMADMGMEMAGMEMNDKKEMSDMKMPVESVLKEKKGDAKAKMKGMEMPMDKASPPRAGESMAGMKMPKNQKAGEMQDMKEGESHLSSIPGSVPVAHNHDHHGAGNSTIPMSTRSRLHEPGTGLEGSGRRALVYTDLRSISIGPDSREPMREIEMHITGNMERYMWSFDGKKYSEARTPIAFNYGERLRLTLVNDTMMEHPIHLHGMWMELENGAGRYKPRKHTISVKPAERLSVAITADAIGQWAMHCHLLLHMELGMFRVVEVSKAKSGARS